MKGNIAHFIKAFLMGVAAATPFLSIATAAFLLGSYQTMLSAVRSIFLAIGQLFRGKPAMAAQTVEWEYLVLTTIGIALGMGLISFVPFYNAYMTQLPRIFALLCGMILGGVGYALYEQRGGNLLSFTCLILGVAASVAMMVVTPEPLLASWLNLLLMGALAIVAHFVPAMPDNFMGTLLGQYTFASYYWELGYWPSLVAIGAGALVVILILAFAVNSAITRTRDTIFSVFMGLLAGLMIQIWPIQFMESKSKGDMMIVGILFLLGCTFSGMMHKHQQRTLG